MLDSLRPARWLPTGNVRTISAANFLTGLYQNVLNVVLQRFVLSFGGGLTLLGFLQAVGGRFGLVAALVQPVGGHLADLRGRRALAIRGSLVAMAGLALLVAAAMFQGQAWAVPALLVPAYLCAGLGMISAPALQSAVAESAHPRARASAFATTTFFWILPGALLAIPGGLIADLLGYGALFGIAFALEAVNLVLFARFLRETGPAAAGSISWRERLAQSLHPPREVQGLFLIVAMDAFAWGLAAGIIYGLLSARFGFSNAELASIAAAWALFFALFLPPTAAFVNRFGPRRCILFSESIGVPIMIGWLVSSRPEHFVLVSVLSGLTSATWVPAIQTYIANWTSPERRAGVIGSLAAFRGIAAFPAPFLGGLMYDHFGYSVPIVANLIGAAVVTATIYFVLRDPPRPEPDSTEGVLSPSPAPPESRADSGTTTERSAGPPPTSAGEQRRRMRSTTPRGREPIRRRTLPAGADPSSRT
ncbi:MAG: MFS transporter [Methanobacteriota archaeon]|nr:MAG: MFS transporter [Euryarchaeota archaeon]